MMLRFLNPLKFCVMKAALVVAGVLSAASCANAQDLRTPLLELTAGSYFSPYDVSIRSGKVTNPKQPYNYTAYVTSNGPSRVYQFNGVYGPGYVSVAVWPYQFNGYLTGIAVDGKRKRVYVLEQEWGTALTDVLVFNLSGQLLFRIDADHYDARGIDVDRYGYVCVTDRLQNQVLMYDNGWLAGLNYTNGEVVPGPGLNIVAWNPKGGKVRDVAFEYGGHFHVLYSPSSPGGLGQYVVSQWGTPISTKYFWDPHGIDAGMLNSWLTSQESVVRGAWSSITQIPQMTISYLFAFTTQIPSSVSGNGCEVVPYFGLDMIFVCDDQAKSVKIFVD